MLQTQMRVLIADSHYLIAMDLERILTETLLCDVSLCPLTDLQTMLRSNSYDVVMVDAVSSLKINQQHVDAVNAAGSRPVFLTTINDFHQAYPDLAAYPLLEKPFDPDAVAAVISKLRDEIALARPVQ
ncbi:hypothetical protein [Rhizobium sp. RU36D]|uniref:hypothetical protein n=1 Tax=Rhizobium sp. RU36D TaxID=1907415 RepID=UPI0009D7EE16|nr:hypothetical protein [Rhizobium sp. RU36D]SMD01637.1 hypothetical protein SAMN05880593_11563 [Rhizobium sp. RU36D]